MASYLIIAERSRTMGEFTEQYNVKVKAAEKAEVKKITVTMQFSCPLVEGRCVALLMDGDLA